MTKRQPIFDSVRTLLGRGFKASEVEQLDRAIDCAEGQVDTCQPPKERLSVPIISRSAGTRRIGEAGIAIIKRFEGCARLRNDGLVEAYPDPGTGSEPWTIGWGATGSGIGPGTVWSQQECDDRLEKDLVRYASGVSRAIGDAPTTQAQFDAMVSFHYNTGAIGRATLTKRHVAGDFGGAAHEFTRWNKAGGRVLKGLTRRRQAEAKLYIG
ncbi:MAG: lysozyme [Erythrobacter sp.]